MSKNRKTSASSALNAHKARQVERRESAKLVKLSRDNARRNARVTASLYAEIAKH